MKPRGAPLAPLLAALGLLLAGLACGREPGLTGSDPTVLPRGGPAVPSPFPTVTPGATTPPETTPPSVDAAVAALSRALGASSASELEPLLLDPVAVGAESDPARMQTLTRAQALQWLDRRWGARRDVVSTDFVEHFVLIEVEAKGWLAVEAGETGTLVFHLHLYDAAGQADPLHGRWRVDGIYIR